MTRLAFWLAVIVAVSAPAAAQADERKAAKVKLGKLTWHAGPEAFDGKKAAKDQRPILWLRMLGELSGKC